MIGAGSAVAGSGAVISSTAFNSSTAFGTSNIIVENQDVRVYQTLTDAKAPQTPVNTIDIDPDKNPNATRVNVDDEVFALRAFGEETYNIEVYFVDENGNPDGFTHEEDLGEGIEDIRLLITGDGDNGYTEPVFIDDIGHDGYVDQAGRSRRYVPDIGQVVDTDSGITLHGSKEETAQIAAVISISGDQEDVDGDNLPDLLVSIDSDRSKNVAHSTRGPTVESGFDAGKIKISHRGGDSININNININIDATDACGETEKLINLPTKDDDYDNALGDKNIKSGSIEDSIISGGNRTNLGVIERGNSNILGNNKSPNYLQFRIKSGSCKIEKGDKVTVEVVYKSGEVIIKEELVA